MPSTKTLAQLLSEYRSLKGLSQIAFAQKAGMKDHTMVSRIESGKVEERIADSTKQVRPNLLKKTARMVAMVVRACGEDPKEWLQRLELPYVSLEDDVDLKLEEVLNQRVTYEQISILSDMCYQTFKARPITIRLILETIKILNQNAPPQK